MKDLLKEKLFRTICVSAIALFALTWFVGWLSDSDLGKFPFDANVWGTASDYFLIVLTIISLYFIYLTLNAQVKSISQQERQLAIVEAEKRSAFRPLIKTILERSSDGEKVFAVFQNLGDPIITIEVDIFGSGQVYNPESKDFPTGKHLKYPYSFHNITKGHSFSIQIKDRRKNVVTFALTLVDKYGFKYRQFIMVSKDGDIESFSLKNIR